MFEITIRTDNKNELQQLLEMIKSMGMQVFKESTGNESQPESKFSIKFPSKKAADANDKNGQKKIVSWGRMEVDISNVKTGFGCAKGMFEMSPDFDEPLADFKEYMY